MNESVEQVIRDILTAALKDGIVSLRVFVWTDPDPQARSSGELVGPANVLQAWLTRAQQTQEVNSNAGTRPKV